MQGLKTFCILILAVTDQVLHGLVGQQVCHGVALVHLQGFGRCSELGGTLVRGARYKRSSYFGVYIGVPLTPKLMAARLPLPFTGVQCPRTQTLAIQVSNRKENGKSNGSWGYKSGLYRDPSIQVIPTLGP